MEFDNDQANQNCHGKKFYSKEDVTVSTQTESEVPDSLDVSSFLTRRGDISDKDDELAPLPQTMLSKDHCDQHMFVKGKKAHEEQDFDE